MLRLGEPQALQGESDLDLAFSCRIAKLFAPLILKIRETGLLSGSENRDAEHRPRCWSVLWRVFASCLRAMTPTNAPCLLV